MNELASTINRFEVMRGALTPPDIARTERLFSRLTLLPLDQRAADAAIAIDRKLRTEGSRIETADTLIAGIALANGLSLITRNVRHFNRIDRLVVETI